MACAQCASMPLIRLLMLGDMLACESRMVVHVTVCAIQSRILGSPSIKTKGLLNPLHVRLLVLLLEVVTLWNWAFLIARTGRIEEAVACIEISDVSPLNCFLLWIRTISWIRWNLTDFSWKRLEYLTIWKCLCPLPMSMHTWKSLMQTCCTIGRNCSTLSFQNGC